MTHLMSSWTAPPKLQSLAGFVFETAILAVVAAGQDASKQIDCWRKSALDTTSGFNFAAFFDESEQLLTNDPETSYRAYSSPGPD